MLKRKSTLLFTIIILSMIMFMLTTTIGLSMQNFKVIRKNVSQNTTFQLSDSLLSEALTELERALINAHREAEKHMKEGSFKEKSRWVIFEQNLEELREEGDISLEQRREMIEKAYELEYLEKYMTNIFKGNIDEKYSLIIQGGNLKYTDLSSMNKYTLNNEILNNIRKVNLENISDQIEIEVDIQNDTGELFDCQIIITTYNKKNDYNNTSTLNIELIKPEKNIAYREKSITNNGLKMNVLFNEWALISNEEINVNGDNNIINGNAYGVKGEFRNNNIINGILSIKEDIRIKNKTTLDIKKDFILGGKLDLHKKSEIDIEENLYRLSGKDKKEKGIINTRNEYNIKYMVENLTGDTFDRIYLKNKFIENAKNINNSDQNTIDSLINYNAASKVSQNLDPDNFIYISSTNESLKIKDGQYSGIIINKGDVELENNVEFTGLIISGKDIIIGNNNKINYDIDVITNTIKNTAGMEEVFYLKNGKDITIDLEVKEIVAKNENKGNKNKNQNSTLEPWEIAWGFYLRGDRVHHDGSIYQCRIRHLTFGDPNWAPGIAHSLWEYVGEYEDEQNDQGNEDYEIDYKLNITENNNNLTIGSQNIEYQIEEVKITNLLEVVDFFEN